ALRASDAGAIGAADGVRPGPGRQALRPGAPGRATDALPPSRADPHLLRRQTAWRPSPLVLLRIGRGSLCRGRPARCRADAALGHPSARSFLWTFPQSLHRSPLGRERRLVSAGTLDRRSFFSQSRRERPLSMTASRSWGPTGTPHSAVPCSACDLL